MGHWTKSALNAIDVASDAAVKTGSIEALRAAIHRDGAVSTDEVHRLLALHRSGEGARMGPGWDDLFLESLVEHFALDHEGSGGWREEDLRPDWGRALSRAFDTIALDAVPDRAGDDALPQTSVGDGEAHALVSALGADGLVLDQLEIILLARLFGRAVTYPMALRAFAWQALAATIYADATVTVAETGLVRALVTGPASCAGLAVSRTEADMVVEITGAIGSHVADHWAALVADVLALHVLYAGGSPGVIDADEHAWLAASRPRLPVSVVERLDARIAALAGQRSANAA